MLSVAVIGAKGYVGNALHAVLLRQKNYQVTAVTRESYDDNQKQSFDIIINCAMPSGRFWAKNNPAEDFCETVEKTAIHGPAVERAESTAIGVRKNRFTPEVIRNRAEA